MHVDVLLELAARLSRLAGRIHEADRALDARPVVHLLIGSSKGPGDLDPPSDHSPASAWEAYQRRRGHEAEASTTTTVATTTTTEARQEVIPCPVLERQHHVELVPRVRDVLALNG
eukprot:5561051-Pyramimonas_sp.AAC.1